MFAARFDPTKVQEDVKPVPTLPQKRSISDAIEEPEDEEHSEEEEGPEEQEEPEEDVMEKEEESEEAEAEASDSDSDSSDDMGLDLGSDSDSDSDSNEPEISPDDNKHNSVLSRFKKTLSIQDKITSTEEDEEVVETGEVHNLAQIPQPAFIRDQKLRAQDTSELKATAFRDTRRIHYNNDMIKPFSDYSDQLSPRLMQNIEKYFSKDTFPIQTVLLDTYLETINFAKASSKKNFTRRVGDILVNASTGSGKTLAYSIPIIQTLSSRVVNKLRVLIVVPTKLLINQVYQTISQLAEGTSIVVSVSKLENSLREEQQKVLKTEPDIFITTPGRLVDHLAGGSLSMKNLKYLVLDEADRLLNQSFQNWVPEVMAKIKSDKLDPMPGNVIKMVFSATLTTNTEKLNDLHLYKPTLFATDSIKLYNLPPSLQENQVTIPTAKSLYKPLYLLRLFDYIKNGKILVFVRSNESSLKLQILLQALTNGGMTKNTIKINSINSNNTKAETRKLVNEFSKSDGNTNIEVLITTDVMSRGIDIESISDVVNYDVPISSQQYVHRCGRTARANQKGNAFNFLVGKGERTFWERSIDDDISRDVDGYHPISLNDKYSEENLGSIPEASEDKKDIFTSLEQNEISRYTELLQTLRQS